MTMGTKGLSGILDMSDILENGDIGRPDKRIVFNRDKKDLSRYLNERVPTWWLIVAAGKTCGKLILAGRVGSLSVGCKISCRLFLD